MNGRLVQRDDLTAAERDAMHALLNTHFRGVTRERFDADLDEKNWVILLEDLAGRLAGFSTFLHYHATLPSGERTGVIYSGDTIVDPRAWNSSVLSRTWIESVWRVHRNEGSRLVAASPLPLREGLGEGSSFLPDRTRKRIPPPTPPFQGGEKMSTPRETSEQRLLWLFITSGFRTYRFLPVFWREFYPRHDRDTPPEVEVALHRLARERFGEQFDARRGVVRFHHPQVLSEALRGIPPAKLADPHVAFFARANPGHGRGDELVCLTELSEANLTPAGWRMVRAGSAARREAVKP